MGIPLGQWSGSNATRELHETIKAFVDASNQQAETMKRLTWAIVGLTVLMLIGLVVQILIELQII
jgi:hypothetical protein